MAKTENVLLKIEEATLNWIQTIQHAQQTTAATVSLMAQQLDQINIDAGEAYDKTMKKYMPKPDDPNFGPDMSKMQAELNKEQGEWDILKNSWNTPMSSETQDMQSLGRDAQSALGTANDPTAIINAITRAVASGM